MGRKEDKFMEDRKYIDEWTAGYFIAGLILGVLFKLTGLHIFYSSIIVAALLILSEAVKRKIYLGRFHLKYEGKFTHLATDVIVGLLGFFIAWFVTISYVIAIIVLMLLLLLIGRIASKAK